MHKNLLLITVDCLRADHVGFLNPEHRALTPNLNALAERSTVFENAFSAGPVTTLSVPALFTCTYPSRLERIKYGVTVGEKRLFSEVIKAQGYDTLAVHSNPFLSHLFGFKRGFDYFYDDLFLGQLKLPGKIRFLMNHIRRLFRSQPDISAKELNDRVYRRLPQLGQPFFMWLHYMDTHGPCHRKAGIPFLNKLHGAKLWKKALRHPEAITESEKLDMIDTYRGEVRYTDEQLGLLMKRMEKAGLLKNTLIVLTADHGESFGERGRYSHTDMMYEELIHVPLLIFDPDRSPSRRTGLVSLLDLFPTLLDRMNIPNPIEGEGQIVGREGEPDRARIFSEARVGDKWYGCVRDKEWKLVENRIIGKRQLFHLPSDPREQTDVSAAHPDKVAELVAYVDVHVSGCASRFQGAKHIDMDKDVENRLRDLGYL